MDIKMMTGEGIVADTTWQAAEVRKLLLAVSSCNDKGNIVLFDNENSCVLPGRGPEAQAIRDILRKATQKIAIQRRHMQINISLVLDASMVARPCGP